MKIIGRKRQHIESIVKQEVIEENEIENSVDQDNATQNLATFSENSKIKSHLCKLCGKRFAKNYDLKRHMKRHDTDNRYVCNMCGEVVYSKSYHIKYHQSKCIQIPCKLCDQTFKLKRDFFEHLRNEHSSAVASYANEISSVVVHSGAGRPVKKDNRELEIDTPPQQIENQENHIINNKNIKLEIKEEMEDCDELFIKEEAFPEVDINIKQEIDY